MRVNLGAGGKALDGYVNVDLVHQDGIDVMHDLDVFPWPWEDASVEEIVAFDVFEHVDHPVQFMTECHRILRPGGLLSIHTSWIGNPESFTDPTHKRFCTKQTFDYWIPGTTMYDGYNKAYGGVAFTRRRIAVGPDNYLDVRLAKPA